jgi:hypothetical protein
VPDFKEIISICEYFKVSIDDMINKNVEIKISFA